MQITRHASWSQAPAVRRFPTSEMLGPDASEEEIRALIDRHGSVFIKPVFKGGVGKKARPGSSVGPRPEDGAEGEGAALLRRASGRPDRGQGQRGDLRGRGAGRARGLLLDLRSTRFRAPTMTLTHHGGMDIEEIDKSLVAQIPFDALTGLKAFVVAVPVGAECAEADHLALVQQLPKLWELYTTSA